MSGKPYNVMLSAPTINVQDWGKQENDWNTLAREVSAVSEFNPLTLKALYVTGLVLNSCTSIEILLRKENLISTTYYPAYIVFASAIELPGRCIRGNNVSQQTTLDLKTGFKWLAAHSTSTHHKITDDHVLAETINHKYSVSDLVALRNFVAHGQAIYHSSHSNLDEFDYLLLSEMPPLIAIAMENYLHELQTSSGLCNSLAKAAITPYRNRPIFDALWGLQADGDLYPLSVRHYIEKKDWMFKFEINLTKT